MTDLRYVFCSICRCVTRLKADEEEICAYCSVNIQGGKEVSESQWRKYWIGVVGQYKLLKTIKKTKQLSLEKVSDFRPELIKEAAPEAKKKTLSVDISRLEQFWSMDLHEFEPGKTYPPSKLINAIGLQHGTPGPKPRGDIK